MYITMCPIVYCEFGTWTRFACVYVVCSTRSCDLFLFVSNSNWWRWHQQWWRRYVCPSFIWGYTINLKIYECSCWNFVLSHKRAAKVSHTVHFLHSWNTNLLSKDHISSGTLSSAMLKSLVRVSLVLVATHPLSILHISAWHSHS